VCSFDSDIDNFFHQRPSGYGPGLSNRGRALGVPGSPDRARYPII